jgi:hypothetical protein
VVVHVGLSRLAVLHHPLLVNHAAVQLLLHHLPLLLPLLQHALLLLLLPPTLQQLQLLPD